MEPWLDKRYAMIQKDVLVLSPRTEKTLFELSKVTGRFLKTMGGDFWHDPYVSALQYYLSIVPAIQGAQKTYPFFSGKTTPKDTLAVSTLLNPDNMLGLKEPLLRYAKAMPGIAETTENFSTSAEYSMFIFCYRILVLVLEELLLSVKTVDVREPFSALYELDVSFEDLRLLFLKCAKTDTKQENVCPDVETLLHAANRCIDALRKVSREFYVVEMLLLKAKPLKALNGNKRERTPECPDLKINEKELSDFLRNLARS